MSELYKDEPIYLKRLSAQKVNHYILNHSQEYSVLHRAKMVFVLKSFLRFLYFREKISSDLALNLPRVPCWRNTTLPGYLTPYEVKSLLKHCDIKTPKGIRDSAILTLLARLGLRAGEVCRLTLEDIDWDTGKISICGKGSKLSYLPLPDDVGKATVRYLRYVRPKCSCRQAFIRQRAPLVGITQSAVSKLVKVALKRANLNPLHQGSHLLRHTCATHLLRKGASISDISQILCHKNPNSTVVYAKVDLNKLQTVTQAWPGGVL